MSSNPPAGNDEHLAYGEYHEGNQGPSDTGERGIIGDTLRRVQKYQAGAGQGNNSGNLPQPTNGTDDGTSQGDSNRPGLLGQLHNTVHDFGTSLVNKFTAEAKHSHTHFGDQCDHGTHNSNHRYQSFAPQQSGNDAKWYVDGCGYMWAVSRALEEASESIWILDWWLSPELYLRRPPSKFENYRVDRLLRAAAERGVKVNIIVYKEVTQALTQSTHPAISAMSSMGLAATLMSLEELEATNPLIAPPVAVSSSHTKHALEDLHQNISVFRHPDHLPDAQTLQSSFVSSFQNLSLSASSFSNLPLDALKAIYGMNDDVVLYWAHHEKLLLVDGKIAFMGGLDLCYGRWDTYQHPIADAHPGDLDDIVFPGQDFNNARVMDFDDVVNFQNNKLDRTTSSRMGWSDVALCLKGPVVQDLRSHFVNRWNYIYDDKYEVRKDTRYSRLSLAPVSLGGGLNNTPHQQSRPKNPISTPDSSQQPYFEPPPQQSRDLEGERNDQQRGFGGGSEHQAGRNDEGRGFRHDLRGVLSEGIHRAQAMYHEAYDNSGHNQAHLQEGGIPCQIVRSCANWSHGVPNEHSVANSYISIIQQSQHFIYIENQFFITATSDAQKPIRNKIGAAIVERILRAAREGKKYKVIVVMPAVPAFAGNLKDDSALGTRAIMEFQYNSINRGGHSILETIAKEGVDPQEYIRFYNLRNYDRINASAALAEAQEKSGVDYNEARRQHDDAVGAGYGGQGEETGARNLDESRKYQDYQQAAHQIGDHHGLGGGRWDSVSECYMLNGEDIRNLPWENGILDEMDAFVCEELYVHSKLLIADDRIVICGSANLNDRSQLGGHDSEIAVIIEDPTPLDSKMDGQPWRASKFAATLRRHVFRKHLGLIPAQDMQRPDQNFEPLGVPNLYDLGSAEDEAVADPLSSQFLGLWNTRARTNTEAFGRIFHPVPHDGVKNWKDYTDFFEKYFQEQGEGEEKKPAKYKWGHVVADEFSPGDEGVKEMKEILSTIRGTLVEMPLLFLIEEDIAKEGLSLNAFTEELYT
ncbi:MAG: hypothetical protein M1837_004832 [Sclerophora amabilis]|nr:MAG: hypothetical protein M1837_004832 [Sclerophora amabilis]